MICWALLEIPLGMHSPFCPFWRIFLPVYHRPFKSAQQIILKWGFFEAYICTFHNLKSNLVELFFVKPMLRIICVAYCVYRHYYTFIQYYRGTGGRGINFFVSATHYCFVCLRIMFPFPVKSQQQKTTCVFYINNKKSMPPFGI